MVRYTPHPSRFRLAIEQRWTGVAGSAGQLGRRSAVLIRQAKFDAAIYVGVRIARNSVLLTVEHLLPTHVRNVDGRAAKWCFEWYFHPEAVSRVEALWRAWEHPQTRRSHRHERLVQRPRRPPHEHAP